MSNIYEAENEAIYKILIERKQEFIKNYAANSDADYILELEDNRRKTAVVLLYNRGKRQMDMMASYGWYDENLYPFEIVHDLPRGRVTMICDLKQIRKTIEEVLSCPGLGKSEGCTEIIEQGERYYFGNIYRKCDDESAIDRGWFDANGYRVYFSIFVDADITAHKMVIPTKIIKFQEGL